MTSHVRVTLCSGTFVQAFFPWKSRKYYIQSGPKKCIHTFTWKILLYNRNYCIYTKAKL